MVSQSILRSALPALGVSLPSIILFIAVLSIPLSIAPDLELTAAQLSSWILVVYAFPGLLGLWLAFRYKQPLALTGNIFAVIFLGSVASQYSYPELIGAFMLAGVLVVMLGGFGLTGKLAHWFPTPIILGLLAGMVLPFVIGIFTALSSDTVMIGSAVVAYLAGRRFFGKWLPPILPAVVAGLVAAGLTGQIGRVPDGAVLAIPTLTLPAASLQALLTVTPVLVVLMTAQANLPSVIFMRSQGYDPPERTVDVVGGGATLLGSLLGPTAASMSLPLTSLLAGRDAGDHDQRYIAAYIAGVALVVIGLLGGAAAVLAEIVPLTLLLTLAGLAVIGVLIPTVQEMVRGPVLLGPVVTFAVSLSDMTLLGFGPIFWALVLGVAVSLLVEREELAAMRVAAANP